MGKKHGFNLFYQAQTTQGLDTKIGMMCQKQIILHQPNGHTRF
jgi:hypothetical protein